MVMILPFIKVYTMGITDANYYRPTFAILITLAEFVWAIRLPYSGITLAAGHFKETKRGAWIEAFTNLILSTILVFKFGIIGVAIGTLVSMIIRTFEFMYHTSEYILQRGQKENIKRVVIVIIEILILTLLGFYISNYFIVKSYITWIILATIVGIITLLVVSLINGIAYRKDLKDILDMIKRIFKGKEVA